MCTPRCTRLKSRQRGLTMVELVIFIVVVSIAVIGILHILSLTTRHSADPQLRKQALSIAEGLLEEVQLARFTFCDPDDPNVETAASAADCASTAEILGPETGNSRPFDNVNDYVSAWGTPLAAFNDAGGNLVDAAGSNITSTGTYSATLTITPEAVNGVTSAISGTSTSSINALRITVTVNYANESLVLEGYRMRYAPTSVP